MRKIQPSLDYDVAIIGAGVSGVAIARELARYQLRIALIEKDCDVATGTTKANSGIVHGGYADKPGSLHAKLCVAGNKLYRKLDHELNFGFNEIGSLAIAFNQDDMTVLQKLYEQGIKNGVPGLSIVDANWLREREPNLSQEIVAALYCKSAGVTSPYEFAIALAENAIVNGVQLFLQSPVTEIKQQPDKFSIKAGIHNVQAKYVINAAGLYADKIAELVGAANFTIHPRQGQYLLFDKDQGALVNSVVFQTPTPISKGILVTRSYHGNLLIGPDANDIDDKQDLATDREHVTKIIATARKTMPKFDLKKVIASFAGNRAILNTGNDFIIEESSVKRFINVAGIGSPGLTAAPAIAEYVVELLGATGLELKKKTDFNPERKPYNQVVDLKPEAIAELIKAEPAYGRIICRCETVSEGEILDALHRNIPITSLDALKRRVRVQMGRCQGGFCTPRLLAIMERELGMKAEEISKKGKGSELIR